MKYSLLSFALLFSFYTNAQNLEWAKTLTGPGSESGTNVTIDQTGNIILSGTMTDNLDLDPGNNEFMVKSAGEGYNTFLAKYTSTGEFLWGGALTCKDGFIGLWTSTDNDNNVIIRGLFTSEADLDPSSGEYLVEPLNGATTAFISKLDSNGKFLWAKTISNNMDFKGLSTDATGNFYAYGQFADTVDFDPSADTAQYISVGPADAYIAKYNKDGEFIWVHTLICEEATNNFWGVYVTDLDFKSSGEIVAVGTFSNKTVFDEYEEGISFTSAAKIQDGFFLELSEDGELNWAKQIATEGRVENPRLNIFSNDSILISARYDGKTDVDPSPKKIETYTVGNTDIFYAKYTSKGDFVGGAIFGGYGYETLTETLMDANDHIYMTGEFGGQTSFVGQANMDYSRTAKGESDIYLVQFTTMAKLICVRSFGYEYESKGQPIDKPIALGLTNNGNVIYYGFFVGEYDMDPNEGETILIPDGNRDLVFAEFSPCSDGIGASSVPSFTINQFKAYPNPSKGIINLDLPDDRYAIITITDVHGRNIDFVRTHKTIDISSAVNGVYFGTIQLGNVAQNFRFVKQ